MHEIEKLSSAQGKLLLKKAQASLVDDLHREMLRQTRFLLENQSRIETQIQALLARKAKIAEKLADLESGRVRFSLEKKMFVFSDGTEYTDYA